jgi:hypothetical protein
MEQKQYKPRQDKFTEARGGWSTLLSIFCAQCKTEVLLYQKDGPGELKRMYLDKIIAPDALAGRVAVYSETSGMDKLSCPQCNSLMGIPMVYEKENRLAYQVAEGWVIEKINKDGKFPSASDNMLTKLIKSLMNRFRSR